MKSSKLWILALLILIFLPASSFYWGFFGHRQINRMAVFTLPAPVSLFYKKYIDFLTEAATTADRRRFSVEQEAPRHYIDLENYGDEAIKKLPKYWKEALEKIGKDSLMQNGIVPWHIYNEYRSLTEAFQLGNTERILRISADLGHYIADAHVPLHTTRNHDGQLTHQDGIHSFWESRLPELNFHDYTFFVGAAGYERDVQRRAWLAVENAHSLVDSVLSLEAQLAQEMEGRKYSFETRGRQTIKLISEKYAQTYHSRLNGMVERQMRASVKMIGDIWFTAWVDAGQPNLTNLINHKPTDDELKKRAEAMKLWKEQKVKTRQHEGQSN